LLHNQKIGHTLSVCGKFSINYFNLKCFEAPLTDYP
jgi:hypothetical protein